MSSVISITLPIFLLIAIGYASTRWGLTTKENIRGIGVFVIRLALPALIFRALSQRALNEIMDVKYLAAYALGSLIPFALMFGFSRFVQKKGMAASAMTALGSSASNSGFIKRRQSLKNRKPVEWRTGRRRRIRREEPIC